MESTARSLLKTISWRIAGSGSTFIISYMLLGSIAISSTIAAMQLTVNTILYFVHERIWDKIKWGRNENT